MTQEQFLVRIWGARGSLPAPAAENVIYGSDSPCVEMRCGDHVLVFDLGSGAESLGSLLAEEGVKDLDIFLSHCHLDHVLGLPFFRPLYDPEVTARTLCRPLPRRHDNARDDRALHGAAFLSGDAGHLPCAGRVS